MPTLAEDSSYYIDFGAKRRMRLDDMGTAECSAGMFDMINVDKRIIESIIKEFPEKNFDAESISKIMFHSSRMLLVTRGLDATKEEQIFSLFGKHFVQVELLDIKFLELVNKAKEKDTNYLLAHIDEVLELSQAVRDLYKNMDDSLRFKVAPKINQEKEEKEEKEENVDVLEKDYRGVGCPMNFVKTKLVLETMQVGQQLQIFLDDGAPIQNVPNSVKLEGHKVLSQDKQEQGYWKVLIEKA